MCATSGHAAVSIAQKWFHGRNVATAFWLRRSLLAIAWLEASSAPSQGRHSPQPARTANHGKRIRLSFTMFSVRDSLLPASTGVVS